MLNVLVLLVAVSSVLAPAVQPDIFDPRPVEPGQVADVEEVLTPGEGLSLANPPSIDPAHTLAPQSLVSELPVLGPPANMPLPGPRRSGGGTQLLLAAIVLSSRIRARRSKDFFDGDSEREVDAAAAQLNWLLEDSWKNDIGKKELERAEAVIAGLGPAGRSAMAQLSDDQLATWIRETRGWLGGFDYNNGSDHLRFLAANVTADQAGRFHRDFLVYLDDAPLANKIAVYEAAAKPDSQVLSSALLGRDPDRAEILNELAGGQSIPALIEGAQFHSLDKLVDPTGLDTATRTELLLASGIAFDNWAPTQTVPASDSLANFAAGLNPEVLTHIREQHSERSHLLTPLVEHLLFADDDLLTETVAGLAGNPQTYDTRFNQGTLAADMGLFMGIAADAASQNAGRRTKETEALVRLAKSVLSATGTPALVGVGGAWVLDETKVRVGSGIRSEADALRKQLYYLALPPIDQIEPDALASYQSAFYGVAP